jgi:small subunit ribosomal protein S30e
VIRHRESRDSKSYSSFHIILIEMGRTHGSLAQAGKVRNKTPKVPKKELKVKPVVGRACLRKLYNKRILANPNWKIGPNTHNQ